jgi:hypothetical protein
MPAASRKVTCVADSQETMTVYSETVNAYPSFTVYRRE